MVEESASSVPVPLPSLTSKICAEHYWPTPLPGHLCEQCLDAPAVLVVPAPGGGDMGICAACQQAAAIATLPVLTAAAGQQTLWHPLCDAERLAAYRGGGGSPAGLVGSLRRDRACPRLPVWELSVALGRGRGDVTPTLIRLQALTIGLPGRQHRADATEHGRLELPHQLADVLHLPCPRPVRAHPLRRDHGLVQDLRQIKPGQLGGG
jgi:hypothetical protein